MYLLDTDSLSALHRGHTALQSRIQHTPYPVATTIISRIEILRGRIEFLRKAPTGAEVLRAQQWLEQSETLLAQIEIVPFDAAAVRVFDALKALTRLHKVGHADLLIASITLACQATLVTRNTRDFKLVPHLKWENWLE
jgi:tRNA(fMet)-specific endonuclease VapC